MTANPVVQATNHSGRRQTAAAIVTGLFAVMMALSGVLYICGLRQVQEGIHALGYPDYFMRFLGLAKLLGATALIAPRMPRLREWAYAGFAFDLIAALVSHSATGTTTHAGPALIALALLAASYLLQRTAVELAATTVRGAVWFSRAILALAALLLTRIALGIVIDPAGTLGPRGFSFGTPDALTAMRVSGGIMLGIAVALFYCVLSDRRLLPGLGFLAAVAVATLAIRLVGLALDGPGPFTLFVIKPEIALVALSSAALVVERRRVHADLVH